MKETELAKYFVDYFKQDGWIVYQEVPFGGSCIDFVAVTNPITIAVEVKTSLNFDVIAQAYDNIVGFNFSYIAVPVARNRGRRIAELTCRNLGIGILECLVGDLWGEDRVSEYVKPRMNRKVFGPRIFHDYLLDNQAGIQSGRITPFGNTVRSIVKLLQRKDGQTIKDIFDSLEYNNHYKTLSATRAGLYQHCNKTKAIKEFYIKNGKLYLSEKPN